MVWLSPWGQQPALSAESGDASGSVYVTALGVRVAANLGMRDWARRWAGWLLSLQRPDGSLPDDPAQPAGSLAASVAGLRAWLAIEPDMPEVQRAVQAATAFVQSQSKQQMSELARRPPEGDVSIERLVRQAELLLDLDVVKSCLGDTVALSPRVATRGLGTISAAILRLVATEPQQADVSAVALLAALWYRLGQREPADGAMRWLEKRVRTIFRREKMVLTPLPSLRYLDAALEQVAAAFGPEDAQKLPASIDPADGRLEAACRWMGQLGPGARVADVGCGSGDLRHLAARFPQARLVGIDPSPPMLAALPPGVTACPGSLLRIPLPDAALDGALAVESLEHALLPQQAVAELCRVVRPGGGVLIIDKHRAKQPLSLHEPWERWFLPAELAEWLARACDEVVVRRVPHLEGRPGRNLFLAASGRRR